MLRTRLGYCVLVYALLPFVLLRLLWKSRKLPGYRRHVGERLGFYSERPAKPVIWLHAVSVGETRAAAPLIKRLQERFPSHQILLTQMTPTGRETAQQLFGDAVICCYLAYDLPGAVARFLAHFRPTCGLIMETEIWPNLIHTCRERRIPVALVNGRLSAKSFARYDQRLRLAKQAFAELDRVAAQSEEDAGRFRALGARTVQVCGNIKFDLTVPTQQIERGRHLRARFGPKRFVWVAASTREGEEELVLDCLRRADIRDGLLILVPRHPERFKVVEDLLVRLKIPYQSRSSEQVVLANTLVLLGDSMGEMLAYYGAADVAFIGGSLLPYGGQNLIEACAVGRPVLIGPHTYNFEEATRLAIEHGAAIQVCDKQELVVRLRALADDLAKRAAMGTAAASFAASSRGALERTWAFLAPVLPVS